MATAQLEIAPAAGINPQALQTFFQSVWGGTGTDTDDTHTDRKDSGGLAPLSPLPAVAAVQNEKVIGYCGSLPFPLVNDGKTVPAYCAKGLMVLPEFRRGPIGFHLAKELCKSLPRCAAIAVARPAIRVFVASGLRDFGAIPNQVIPLRLANLASAIDPAAIGLRSPGLRHIIVLAQNIGVARWGGKLAGAIWHLTRAFREAGDCDVREWTKPTAMTLDQINTALTSRVAAGTSKSSDMVLSRYPTDGSSPYTFVLAERRGHAVGWAVIRQPRAHSDARLRGLRVATLSDIAAAPDDAGALASLIKGAEKQAAQMGADALIAACSHHSAQRVLKRRWWINFGSTLHLLCKVPDGEVWPSSLNDWWLNRGDGRADEVF